MNKLRVLHTADWHLRDSDIEEGTKCLDVLISTARAERPDLIAIAGDIYDRQDVKLDSKAARLAFETVSTLTDIAPTVILHGTYSHEGTAPELFSNLTASGRLFISDPVFPQTLIMFDGVIEEAGIWSPEHDPRSPDAVISMVPPVTKKFLKTLAFETVEDSERRAGQMLGQYLVGMGAVAADYDAPHILVGHWTVGGCNISDTQIMVGRDIELNQGQISAVGADLVCLGHIHYAQRIGSNIFYSGSLYRKDFGELEEKGFWIHDLYRDPSNHVLTNDGGVAPGWDLAESRFVLTPTRKLHKHRLDITPENPMPGAALLTDPEIAGANMRVEIAFGQDDEHSIDFAAFEQAYRDAGAESVEIVKVRRPSVAVRSERILKMQTFGEKLAHYADLDMVELTPGMREAADMLETMGPDDILAEVTNV